MSNFVDLVAQDEKQTWMRCKKLVGQKELTTDIRRNRETRHVTRHDLLPRTVTEGRLTARKGSRRPRTMFVDWSLNSDGRTID